MCRLCGKSSLAAAARSGKLSLLKLNNTKQYMKLAHAIVFAKDLPCMEAFYSAALRLSPVEETRQDTWVEFDSGATRLALHAIPPRVAQTIDIASPPRPRENTPIKLIFEVEDLDTKKHRLESLGASIVERPWGDFDVIDPEGNIFGIRNRQT